MSEEKDGFDEEIKEYTERIEKGEKTAENYRDRGIAYFFKRKYDEAISDLSKVIELVPENMISYYIRGVLYCQKAKYDEAIEDLTEAIKLRPDHVYSYHMRGVAYYEKKEYDKAIKDFTKAIDLAKNAEVYYWRGLTYEKLDNIENAINDSKKAVEINPADDNFRCQLIQLYLKKGEYNKALENVKYIKKSRTAAGHSEILKPFIDVETKKVTESLRDVIDKIKNKLKFEDGEITHYTKIRAADEIVLKKSPFRLSHISYLNDPTEGEELPKYLGIEKQMGVDEKRYAFSHIFIGSFSGNPNALSLWRFYGDDAEGCSITLNGDFLDKQSGLERLDIGLDKVKKVVKKAKTPNNVKIYQVAYFVNNNNFSVYLDGIEDSVLKDLFLNLQDQIKSLKLNGKYNANAKYLKDVDKDFKKEVHKELPNAVNVMLDEIKFLVKSDHYKDEIEYRIIVNEEDVAKIKPHYNKDSEIIDSERRCHIELESDILKSITKITIGPKVDRPEEKAAEFKTALLKAGNTTAEIYISTLPYK